jgi:hypothetical protein
MKTPFNYAILLVSLSFLLFAPRADAVIYLLGATIDGAQANAGAGTGSMGIGSMTGSYDDGGTPATGGTFAWNINWSGLTGMITVAHFHGPAAAGMNAGVQVNFGSISGLTSPSIGSTSINSVQAGDLLNVPLVRQYSFDGQYRR